MKKSLNKELPADYQSVVPQKKKNLKRGALIVLIVLAALAVLCLILGFIQNALKKDTASAESNLFTPNNKNADGKQYITYYEPDYEADILKDDSYLAKNRTVKYVYPSDTGSSSVVLDEYDNSELDEGQRFFMRYFDICIHGDYTAYPTLFTEPYKKNPLGFEKHPQDRKFPMQRIYDITVTELGKSDPTNPSFVYDGKQAVFGVYKVSYKILKNDGELRIDLAENGEVPLIFELVTTDFGKSTQQTAIHNLYRYADVNAKQE